MMDYWPNIFVADTPQELYRRQLQRLLKDGSPVEVRGRKTLELQNVITIIKQPWRRVLTVPGRRWNPWLALSECLHLVAGRNDVDSLSPYNKNICQFSDDGKIFYGSYGYRVKDQISGLLERLRRESTDRRATLLIWRPEDLMANTKDPPCHEVVMFKIRDGQLNMTVVNRSNDIHWGLYAVNLPEFSFLQEVLAWELSVKQGWQYHLSNSLHVYLDGPSQEITERMIQQIDEQFLTLNHDRPIMGDCRGYFQFVEGANLVLNEGRSDGNYMGIPFLEFASDFLRAYREKDWKFANIRHALDYQSWIFSARYWSSER